MIEIILLIILLALGMLLFLAALWGFYTYMIRKAEKRRLVEEQMELQEFFIETYQEMLREAQIAKIKQGNWYK